MELEKYIGKSKVVNWAKNEAGNLVSYLLEDGSKDEVTPEQFESMALENPYADGDISPKKWKPTVKKILETLLADGLRLGDKDFVLNQVDNSINMSYNQAIGKLFGKNHPFYVTMADLDRVLKLETGSESKAEEVA